MDAQSLIECWEHGRRRHTLDRALLLHAAADPAADPETLADRTLGERNAALLCLRQTLFGDALKSCVDCPECGERLEFALSAAALLERAPASDDRPAFVECRGRTLRLPTTRDLASVANEPDEASATDKLLERLLADGAPAELSVAAEELTTALDAADPCMDLGTDLTCPACEHQWSATFDVPGFLWEEIDVRVRRLLDEVHTLARAYSWSEGEILALSDTRRRAYLDRVMA